MNLWTPPSFRKASTKEKLRVCNGCGPAGWKFDLIPDKVYGLSIAEACDIHDWMYHKGQSIEDKDKADRVFLNNMVRIVLGKSRFKFMRVLRRRRCYSYYLAVSKFGGPAFWNGKGDSA